MLLPPQILPFLDHPDRDVREFACRYLTEGNDPGGATADDLWRVIDRSGAEETLALFVDLDELPQTQASYARLLVALRGDLKNPYRLHLDNAFAWLDWSLLLAHRDEVLSFDAVPQGLRDHQAQRLALEGVPLNDLWAQFLARAREVRNKYLGKFDDKAHKRLIEAMARQYPQEASERAAALLGAEDDGGWLHIFCADLLGETRHRPAIPVLLDAMGVDSDLLPERAGKALARMGDADVVRRIEALFPEGTNTFRICAPDAIGAVRVAESEGVLRRLLQAEVRDRDEAEDDAPSFLAAALLELCPTEPESLEALRDVIVTENYDGMMFDLDAMILPVCTMVGYDPPEAAGWRKRNAEREKRRGEPNAMVDPFRSLFEWDGNEDDERQERKGDGGLPPRLPARPAPEPPPPPPVERPQPIRRGEPKVGRNDPCPCGSGKKYKKCCMAKDEVG